MMKSNVSAVLLASLAIFASSLQAQTDPPECERPSFLPRAVATETDRVQSISLADLDGDGDFDVLSGSGGDGMAAWYENVDGLGNFGLQRVIMAAEDETFTVYAADLDGDGDADVLSAMLYDGKIIWFENSDGQGKFGPQRIMSSEAVFARSVFAADLDGDGDIDVLSASTNDNKIAWYENIDGAGNFGPQQVITSGAYQARSVFASDLDGDGDIDVLSASMEDDKIAWYQNLNGLGLFSSEQVITSAAEEARSVFASDLDGDGDADVLSASSRDRKIAWYENTNQLGNFGPQQIISDDVIGATAVIAGDLDGDGDMDVLSAAASHAGVAWYQNIDGLGTFSSGLAFTDALWPARSVIVADLDGDGDTDVVSGASGTGPESISWHENEADCNSNGISDGCDLGDKTGSDCNGNLLIDECDIDLGLRPDCNTNRVPDWCDILNGVSPDCNANYRPDECDITEGGSADCDSNGVPDECERGCNGNHQPDACDVADGTSLDCDENGVPDECEDCNGNGVGDACDIRDGTSLDCQGNGVPDECDLETMTSQDIDLDGILDECQACEDVVPGAVPLASLKAVAVNGVSIEPTNCLSASRGDVITTELYISGWGHEVDWMRAYQVVIGGFKQAISGDYGVVLPLDWVASVPNVFCSGGGTCPDGLECIEGELCLATGVETELAAFVEKRGDHALAGENTVAADVTPQFLEFSYFGATFEGGPSDYGQTGYIGTLMLRVSADACGTFRYQPIKNENGDGGSFFSQIYYQAIHSFSLQPLQLTVPDCDCNENGFLDPEEILKDPSIDCDGNLIPDSCDMVDCDGDRGCMDCNGNLIMDACEILDDSGRDEDGNGIPDDCFFPIPTVSGWGMGVLALLLLVGAKLQSIRSAGERVVRS